MIWSSDRGTIKIGNNRRWFALQHFFILFILRPFCVLFLFIHFSFTPCVSSLICWSLAAKTKTKMICILYFAWQRKFFLMCILSNESIVLYPDNWIHIFFYICINCLWEIENIFYELKFLNIWLLYLKISSSIHVFRHTFSFSKFVWIVYLMKNLKNSVFTLWMSQI